MPYSHWTGGTHGRLYAAWYFLAPAPDGEVVLDEHECLDHRWIRPADAVAGRDRGEIAIVAPTWMTLHSLSDTRTVADALALACSAPAGRLPVAGRRTPAATTSCCGTATPATRPAIPTSPAPPPPRHGHRRLVVPGLAGRLTAVPGVRLRRSL